MSRNTQFSIQQQNINKSLVTQSDLLHQLNLVTFNICAIQEPYLDHLHNSCTTPHWFTVYPKEHYTNPGKTQSLLLVNRRIATDAWSQVDFGSSDITSVQVHTTVGKILIVNMYSNNMWQVGMK